MLKITAQTNQAINLDNTATLTKSTLEVLHIDMLNDEVRLRHTVNNDHTDFTMVAGESMGLDEDTKLYFTQIGNYKSDARNVNYVGLGFDAPRHVIIKGEWMLKGNK